jgi:hypothetical protein
MFNNHDLDARSWNCKMEDCQAWEPKAQYNLDTKEYEGDCRLFMLERKISGGINTHAY